MKKFLSSSLLCMHVYIYGAIVKKTIICWLDCGGNMFVEGWYNSGVG